MAWVNQSLFDYKNLLRTGTTTLFCWPFDPEDPIEDNLRPIGQCRIWFLCDVILGTEYSWLCSGIKDCTCILAGQCVPHNEGKNWCGKC